MKSIFKACTFLLLAAGSASAAAASADSLEITAAEQGGMLVASIKTNKTHPVFVQEVFVPNGVEGPSNKRKAISERKLDAGNPDEDGVYYVNLGSVGQVFDGAGSKDETAAELLARGKISPGECKARSVPLRIVTKDASGEVRQTLTGAVEARICNR